MAGNSLHHAKNSVEKNRIFKAFLLLLLVAAIYLILHYPPNHNPYYPKCLFKQWTKLDCPGCGSTRATYELLKGHFIKAADANLLYILLLPIIGLGLLATLTPYGHLLWKRLNRPIYYFVLIVIFWVLRNINYFPFTWLHSDK